MTPRARAFLVASVLVLAAVAILGWSKLHAGPALASKASAPTLAASPPNLRKTRAETPALFRQALDLGATISVTADKASFTVLWSPEILNSLPLRTSAMGGCGARRARRAARWD